MKRFYTLLAFIIIVSVFSAGKCFSCDTDNYVVESGKSFYSTDIVTISNDVNNDISVESFDNHRSKCSYYCGDISESEYIIDPVSNEERDRIFKPPTTDVKKGTCNLHTYPT